MIRVPEGDDNNFNFTPVGPLGIIPMTGCRGFADGVNDYLIQWSKLEKNQTIISNIYPGYDRDNYLIDASCPRFATGEGKGLIKKSIRGYDLFFISDVLNYSCTYKAFGQDRHMSPDDHFQDLKRVIAAASGKAARVSVIMPFLYEGRQHRRSSRESLDCAVALQELEGLGVSNILTFDAHDPRVENAIPLTGFESIYPTYQVLKALLREEKDLKIDKENMIIISPDEGAIKRNIYYSTVMGLNLGLFVKRRDYTKIVNGRNPIIAHDYLGEDVAGKDVFIFDDIISTGESMLDLIYDLKSRKAKRIFVAATFGFFTDGIESFQKAYEDGALTRLITTNLNYRREELLSAPWYTSADMTKYVAYIIAMLNNNVSLSRLLNPIDRINALLERYAGTK